MASIQDEASGKKGGEIRYLTPLNIDNSTVKKYCRFKKYGIKYVDYKDSDFLLKFINDFTLIFSSSRNIDVIKD